MLKIAWRTLSEVGLTRLSDGVASLRPPRCPPVILTNCPSRTGDSQRVSCLVPEIDHVPQMSLWWAGREVSISASMVSFRAVLLALVAFVSLAVPAAAQVDSAPKVHARLIAENGEVAPGGTVDIALEEDVREGWHTYWQNSGEAGAPTTIDWTLPQGWRVGAIQWPYPKRLPAGPLMQYGYSGKPWLLM